MERLHETVQSLERLAADVARFCHARQAVLSCGSTVVAEWSGRPGPRFVVAAQPFGVGPEAYELKVCDDRARELTPAETGAFRAILEVFQRLLAEAHLFAAPSHEAWVKDHVAVAVDYVTDAFLLLVCDWTIQHVNTQFERDVGVPRADLLGRKLWDVLPQLAGSTFEAEARAAMAGTAPRVFEMADLLGARWFQCRAFPCKEGLAILSIDLTERRKDELARADFHRRTLQSQRMESLGTLAGGIAHDFNNILGAILGHVGLLKEARDLDARSRESVEQIGVAGSRARDLVHQILTFARVNTREFVRQPVGPLVEESLRLLRSTLPSSVHLETSIADEPMASTLNPTEVQQLVMNLGTNAWHALDGGAGRITVQLARANLVKATKATIGKLRPGAYAQLVVSDAGGGIDADKMARLFEPFFTTKPRGQGTGLGLHVVHGIVTAHGGAVVVRSQKGVGSQFAVYLPTTACDAAEPPPAPPDAALPGLGERVAYVDDDEVVMLMVQRVLERAGFAVTAFSDPHRLVDAMRVDPACFDLLVTDFSMPGMNGLEVARAVRDECPHIPVIIATGYVPDDLEAAVEALGDAEILNKEHTFEELGARAARAVRGFAPSKL